MNQGHNSDFDPRHLYRDTQNKSFAGVCAGIAKHFGFAVGPTRFVTLVAIMMTLPLGLFLYIGAAILLKPMPNESFKNRQEEVFWQEIRRSPKATFSNVRFRLRQIDKSLQRLERYVTSSRFATDRGFRDLEAEDRASRTST
ncbi:MAG: PspC domain-containing protein [Pseudomonadota bacterium]